MDDELRNKVAELERRLERRESEDIAKERDLTFLLANLDGKNLKGGIIEEDVTVFGKIRDFIDDRSADLAYTPTPQSLVAADPWYQFAHDLYFYDNTVTRGDGSHATTQEVEYTFTGSTISIIAGIDGYSGKIDVYIDGTLDETVDLYSAVERGRQEVYIKSGMPHKRHIIKVICRTDKNASSLGYYFYFDGFRMGTPLSLKNVDIVMYRYSLTSTTNANGYKLFDTLNFSPTGYSSLGVTGVAPYVPDPDSAAADKPKVGHTGRYIQVWDGPAAGTISVNVSALYIKS